MIKQLEPEVNGEYEWTRAQEVCKLTKKMLLCNIKVILTKTKSSLAYLPCTTI